MLCLRDTGMQLSEIRCYMDLCTQGQSTLAQRLEIIRQQKEKAYGQMAELRKKIDHLEWKERHYLKLIQGGTGGDCNPLEYGEGRGSSERKDCN